MATQFRRVLKMEHAARLEAQMVPDPQIAAQLGLSPAGLAQLKQDPDYNLVRTRILSGVISQLDEDLSKDIDYSRERIREMVPIALDGLYENAVQTADKKLRQTACEAILDRDGKLAKVSRIGLPTESQGGIGTKVDEDVANSLINLLVTTRQKQQAEQEDESQEPELSSAEPASTKIQ